MRFLISVGLFIALMLGTLFAYGWMHDDASDYSNKIAFRLASFPVPTTTPALQKKIRQFTKDLETAMINEHIPGLSLAIVYEGQPVFVSAYGTTDLDEPYPVKEETVFRLASLSKGFASVLVGNLVDEGTLHWDDPVSKFLPDFQLQTVEATQKLSIRHLLSHTTGLSRHAYSNLLNQNVPYRDIVPMLKDVKLAHEPGTWYNYQNVAYSLIADIVEAATGISYDSLLEERIFLPLNMEQASVGYSGMAQLERAARPHAPDAMGYHRLAFKNNWYDVSPAAGVNASARDLVPWLQLLLGQYPEVLSSESLTTITTKQIDVSPRENVMRAWRPMTESGYGLGWRTVEKSGRQIIFHGGFVNGYRAEIGFCPEEEIGIAILSNGGNYFMRDALPNFFEGYFEEVAAAIEN